MNCPHCNYTATNKRGLHGPFFRGGQRPVVLTRNRIKKNQYAHQDEAIIVGCPACRKTFIEFEIHPEDE